MGRGGWEGEGVSGGRMRGEGVVIWVRSEGVVRG